MSVVVKGMRIPKSCGRCWFNNSSLSCAITGSCIDRDDENRERLDDCPLVDLGKHGDLIDRDALEQEMLNGIKAGNLEEGYEMYANINTVDDCVECVRWADAVIEAEGK
jgi:hypothetical protein